MVEGQEMSERLNSDATRITSWLAATPVTVTVTLTTFN